MIGILLAKIFGTKEERDIKRLIPIVNKVNSYEDEISAWPEGKFKEKTQEFKERIAKGESIDEILPEAFALVREASKRTIGLRPFDVQIMGGVVLYEGKITEMKTGEGKTLVATMPLYLNALLEKGCHLVTVNDYLAKRDAQWMGPIYEYLGLSVGFLQHDMNNEQKKIVYNCDITYGTNNEFGFDYLRDNMVPDMSLKVQRGHFYAIVDEVDSILIDEARTPLIISGPSEESVDKYYKINQTVPYLKRNLDYQVDEKMHTAFLTEDGVRRAEGLLRVDNLYDPRNIEIIHHINQALKAHTLFKRDVDYMVKDGEVIIIDEFTGRLMPGRRFSEGLHQALEAKEGVKVKAENQTLATITLQNYFRMYEKLAGMTGTAKTSADEFYNVYGLDVVVIPPNKPMIRKDCSDVIYKTEKAKFEAIVDEIEKLHKKGQPILVGTISVEKSERLSRMLKSKGIPHQVLNAKYHEMEACIVAQAGRKGMITIATNMAGRGTDIILGGNPPDEKEHNEVVSLDGLHIIGTERHEARRIDNQLRGRSGRQGDPGSSRFYISLEDDLMRLFGSEKIAGVMTKLGLRDDEVIEHSWITKSIENAQKRVEIYNFDIRKRLLEFDDVMNQQRTLVYNERDMIMKEENLEEHFKEMCSEILELLISLYLPSDKPRDDWDIDGFRKRISQIFGINHLATEKEELEKEIEEAYEEKKQRIGKENMKNLQKVIMLSCLDSLWKDHLYSLDSLRESIHLRAYGHKDPLVEYKIEASRMFEELVWHIKEGIVSWVFKVELERPKETQRVREIPVKLSKKIGRNQPCPCGSGKKYKYCCGR
ncbi:TPA: preprotein translocase subunit SecA [bacterium]|nr:preprotein translocase subunit SecA [bacterium]